MDAHYTPTAIAKKMVDFAGIRPSVIADFSVGGGELLKAAAKKWSRAKIFATDIDIRAVKALKRENVKWKIGVCDFLSLKSQSSSEIIRSLNQKTSLILLNPPFSCRGGTRRETEIGGQKIECSLGLAFVIESIKYLSKNGKIIAILPTGCLTSDKDKAAWNKINSILETRILFKNKLRAFQGCVTKTVIVEFKLRNVFSKPLKPRNHALTRQDQKSNQICLEIFRGKIQMHTLKNLGSKSRIPFIHSTELLSNSVNLLKRRAPSGYIGIEGPIVFIPRVGFSNPDKISLYLLKKPVVISDCIVAIKCFSIQDAKAVFITLREKWSALYKQYGGTCANYIKVEDLKIFLIKVGYRAELGRKPVHFSERLNLPSARQVV